MFICHGQTLPSKGPANTSLAADILVRMRYKRCGMEGQTENLVSSLNFVSNVSFMFADKKHLPLKHTAHFSPFLSTILEGSGCQSGFQWPWEVRSEYRVIYFH